MSVEYRKALSACVPLRLKGVYLRTFAEPLCAVPPFDYSDNFPGVRFIHHPACNLQTTPFLLFMKVCTVNRLNDGAWGSSTFYRSLQTGVESLLSLVPWLFATALSLRTYRSASVIFLEIFQGNLADSRGNFGGSFADFPGHAK